MKQIIANLVEAAGYSKKITCARNVRSFVCTCIIDTALLYNSYSLYILRVITHKLLMPFDSFALPGKAANLLFIACHLVKA